jgi:glutamate carboxypeptidase
VARFPVTVRGIPAHAGLEPTAGASAIVEMADVVLRLQALNDVERGTTLNVGTIQGGTRRNVVAAEAVAEVDVRVATAEDGVTVERMIRAMKARRTGTTLHVEGGLASPPLEHTSRNRALWCQALVAGERLGLSLQEYAAGGASDGNTTSQLTATLDGLGAIGDGAHARHESVSIAGLSERAALLAELLMAPVEAK